MLTRSLLQLLSRGGSQGRLSILIYHRVAVQPDPLFPDECDARRFDAQLRQLATCFNVIPLSDAVRGLNRGKLPPRAACITFDDGYADNAEVALPILQRHGLSATFFVAAGFLDGGRMWNDTVIELVRRAPGESLDLSEIDLGRFEIGSIPQRREAIANLIDKLKYLPMESRQVKVDEMCALIPAVPPDNLMMTSNQLRALHASGMEIGGHTVNHPILARTEDSVASAEIANGKEMLEGIIRSPVRIFAYPNGKPERDYMRQHPEMVKHLGFDAAVSTAHGTATPGSDVYQLPRFTPWDRSELRFTLRMAQNMLTAVETA
ncbi:MULTISPECIES: polysaccharide deacetylase family protein [unclassified Nitrosospira]|uniref:polysaccharide deacetylase family protein n=1 Tax=unclassified Nitrosospira TaxID=2609267 RepID=UPI000D325A52|nr:MULTISPECIES: polysaccharide deacetylase family protein [unclassified Nitrosospira]PTR15137.1 peptidoglycan/xylan/chitin deacetylase (PgdA/CDA1 family) [Nitrosospira sp. Nsp2]WON72651.1 polysaccharide deacetylase family protein [Nitrosospira sp. Is2]